MQECDDASLYGLGLLDEADSKAFELHLNSCPSCVAEVRESRELAVRLAGAIPVSTPPVSLRNRVLVGAVLPRGLAALVRGAKVQWQPAPFDGVSIARLYEDPLSGGLTSLVRMMPGARLPSHRHASLEHCYVVEGDVVFEDHSLAAGDYFAASAGGDHTTATTTTGCLLFIVDRH